MLDAGQVPLGLRGWHRVSVGLLWGNRKGTTYGAAGNRLKLSGDASFRPLIRETPSSSSLAWGEESIEESYLACADLTGQDLVVRAPAHGSGAITSVAYVRCEPLTPDEISRIEQDRRRADCRRIIAYNDGFTFFFGREQWDREDFSEMLEPYRHSDVESVYWGLVGDLTVFPARHGTMPTGPGAERFESLTRRGINPVICALEQTHQMGLKFFIYQRMGAWISAFPGEAWSSDFALAHPEFRCLNREGSPIPHMSYAYPEVRRRQIDLLACARRGKSWTGSAASSESGSRSRPSRYPLPWGICSTDSIWRPG